MEHDLERTHEWHTGIRSAQFQPRECVLSMVEGSGDRQMTTTPQPEVNKQETEIIAMTCKYMDEWISSMDDLSADEQRVVDDYLLAKKNFLIKTDTLLVLFFTHEKNKYDKADE